jgi:hypothetical protein
MRRLLFVLILLGLIGCSDAPAFTAVVNLSQLEALPDVPATEVKPLRIVVAIISHPGDGRQLRPHA